MKQNNRISHFSRARQGSRVFTTIIIFFLTAVFAGKINAQTKVNVPLGTTGYFNHPSVAIRPWDAHGNPDGKTIVVSGEQSTWANHSEASFADPVLGISNNAGNHMCPLWDDNQTYTSKSTDGGLTWSTNTNIPVPIDPDPEEVDGSDPGHDDSCSGGNCYMYGAADAQLAYRQNSGVPQLLCTYSSYEDGDGDDDVNGGYVNNEDYPLEHGGIFVSFSGDDGNSWGTPASVQIEVGNSFPGGFVTRPMIAADINPGGAHQNNAYICWTLGQHGIVPSTETAVEVSTIPPGSSPSPGGVRMVAHGDPSSNLFVDACAISVASDGNVFLLWDQRNTTSTPATRDLFISVSTDGGSTWTAQSDAIKVNSSSLIAPDNQSDFDNFLGNGYYPWPYCWFSGGSAPGGVNIPDYQDYPAMTVSKGGSSETVFIAYTAGNSSVPMNPPSDIFLSSASVTDVEGGSPAWSTTPALSQISSSYSGTSNTNPFSLQFQPSLCPNGCGGVFLLYYSQQVTPYLPFHLPPVGPVEVPVVYEGFGTTCTCTPTQTVISTPIPSFTNQESKSGNGDDDCNGCSSGLDYCADPPTTYLHGVGDFISIAWDPVIHCAYPVWTDLNSGTDAIFTTNVFTPPPGEVVANPIIGGLGYSSERKIVTVDNVTHVFGSRVDYPNLGIYHSYQLSAEFPILGQTTTEWSTPALIPPSNFDYYPTFGGAGGAFSVASYERGGTTNTNQNAIAVCWEHKEEEGANNLKVVISEELCDGIDNWSKEFDISSPLPSNAYVPSIAPLTVPVATGSKERYLLGWIITWNPQGVNNSIYSQTILRGPQTPTYRQLTHNDNWGDYSHYTVVSGSQVAICPDMNPYDEGEFVSSTANQSNGILSDHSVEIAFTGIGIGFVPGCYVQNTQYNVTSGSSTLGNPISPLSPGLQISTTAQGYLDRNPSVTINSAGQNIVAWEHMENSNLPPGNNPQYVSKIKVAEQQKPLPLISWFAPADVISSLALDYNFRWLLNPSVSAFPNTRLLSTTSSSTDQDPDAAEMLFWVESTASGNPPTETLLNQLHERQFYRTPTQNAWLGQWIPQMQDPFTWGSPFPNGFSGTFSQRSFGVFNTGPQYDPGTIPIGQLYDELGNHYIHGLSYGIGNPVNAFNLTIPDQGFAFKGTFDTALRVQLYRTETRQIDSSAVEFRWGQVYVEDTALGLPIREVMLHNGQPDSAGFVSNDAIRDSIFCTEWFNWPVSAEINYNRWMVIPTGGHFDTVIDTATNYNYVIDSAIVDTIIIDSTVVDSMMTYDTLYSIVSYDTVEDSMIGYDTVPGTFVSDTSDKLDSSFIGAASQMQYTVQLIHVGGAIDTIEQPTFNPSIGLFISPKAVHIVNAEESADTVMLRVVGVMTNLPDCDTSAFFERETFLDSIYGLPDTTFATGGAGPPIVPPLDSCFAAIGPYPDPSEPSGDNVSILVSYCGVGLPIMAQVYNVVGSPIGAPVMYISDGQTWDRLEIPAPSSAGAYYIVVSVGAYTQTLSYSVY